MSRHQKDVSRRSQYFRSGHLGVDLAPKTKGEQLEIRAAGDGEILYAGICLQGWCKGHGGTVVIKHPNGQRTLYAHLNYVKVAESQMVKAGQIIGMMGDSGVTTGPILHFEICKTYCSSKDAKTKESPLKYLDL